GLILFGLRREVLEGRVPELEEVLEGINAVTAVDGQSVADAASLTAAVGGHSPGDRVTLSYTRDGSTHTLSVALGTRPSSS
ncbi:MAG: PDZ domain-containing protein, partial [Gaiellaceae bacterium]